MKKRKAGRPKRSMRQWLEKLPEPYKSKAIAYTKPDDLNKTPHQSCRTLAEVLFSAFLFAETAEGGDYWNDFYKSLKFE